MYFAIEVAALALMVSCTVQLWRLSRRLIDERDSAYRERDRFRRNLVDYMEIAGKWHQQAEAFEATAKKHEKTIHAMDEHIAAERARADKLAAALQEAEDRADALGCTLADLRSEMQTPEPDAEAPTARQTAFEREMANIFAYNGTAEGQEELNDE